ncbi:uncharacterized protein LOC124124246 isoform X1 [Haliotis rufescens]|uniref:uncharacterized protein LOC124124246 isoform X1 n=1 Tax=Haliotis rufescens TaxID=6454 RepID=UPI00201EA77F|nr:uncharacterized protein LOC124124246 isoform X1 [Haliotis rufescens]
MRRNRIISGSYWEREVTLISNGSYLRCFRICEKWRHPRCTLLVQLLNAQLIKTEIGKLDLHVSYYLKTLPQQLQFFQRLFKPCRILPYDGAFVPPTYMYSESVMSADDVPQVDAVSHVKATKTLSDKDTILNIEREKLNVL